MLYWCLGKDLRRRKQCLLMKPERLFIFNHFVNRKSIFLSQALAQDSAGCCRRALPLGSCPKGTICGTQLCAGLLSCDPATLGHSNVLLSLAIGALHTAALQAPVIRKEGFVWRRPPTHTLADQDTPLAVLIRKTENHFQVRHLACSQEGAKRGVQTPAARAAWCGQGAPLLPVLQLSPCQGATPAPSKKHSQKLCRAWLMH